MTIPRQDNAPIPGKEDGPQLARARSIDWRSIIHKSRVLFTLPPDKLRNRTLRRIVDYAHRFHTDLSSDQRYAAQGVVYVVFHVRTSRFYVGETKYDGRKRLAEHWQARSLTKGGVSTLSNHMAKFCGSNPDGWSEFRVFPVHVGLEDESARKRVEGTTISELRRGAIGQKCLNNPALVLGKRLRHHPQSRPPPSGPSGNPATVQLRSRYENAAKHLELLNDKNRFAELSKMRDSTLCGLKRTIPPTDKLGKQLRQIAADRQRDRARAKRDGPRFVVTFASRKMQKLNIRAELQRHANQWPFDRQLLEQVHVVYKPLVPRNFRNHVDASLNAFNLPDTCMCHQLNDKFKVGGHVLTADPEVFLPLVDERHREAILWLIEHAGPKVRTDLGHIQVLASIRSDLESFVDSVTVDVPPQPEAKKRWVDGMFDTISTTIYSSAQSVRSPVGNMNIPKVLEKVHQHFVLAPADKNAQNTVIWCQSLYRQSIATHLSEPVFKEVTATMPYEAIMEEHRDLAELGGKEVFDTLPYVYKLAKIHKLEQNPDRPPSRPIAGKSVKNKPGEPSAFRGSNSLSAVHQQTAKMLQSVMDLLVLRDRRSASGVKYCWFVRTAQEVIDTVCSDPTIEYFETSDFSDMYTNIPLNDLVDELYGAIDIATEELAHLFDIPVEDAGEKLAYTPLGKWKVRPNVAPACHWTMDKLKRIVGRLVWSTYVRVGDRLFHQIQGVGMGQESAPPMAQLYLHMKERRWINKTIQAKGRDFVARRYNNFRSFVRFMDDNLFPVCRDEAFHDLLPEAEDYNLAFNVTATGSRVKFLGLEFSTTRRGPQAPDGRYPHEVRVTAYDKQQSFAFTLIRYPSWHSNMPHHIVVGSITGLLSRFFRHTSTTEDFLKHAVDGLTNLFRLRDYPNHAVKSGIVKFVRRNIEMARATEVRDALFRALEHVVAPPPRTEDVVQAVNQPSGAVQLLSIAPVAQQDVAAPAARAPTPVPAPPVQRTESEEAPAPASISASTPKSGRKTRAICLRPRMQTRAWRAQTAQTNSQLHSLTQHVVELTSAMTRLSQARCDADSTSSVADDSQRVHPTNTSIQRSASDNLRELYGSPSSSHSATTTDTSEFLRTVQRLCDTMSQQSVEHIQLVRDVIASRPDSHQPDETRSLVTEVRREASSFLEVAVAAMNRLADRPQNSDNSVVNFLLQHMSDARRAQLEQQQVWSAIMDQMQRNQQQALQSIAENASNAGTRRLLSLVEERLALPATPTPIQIEYRQPEVQLVPQVLSIQHQIEHHMGSDELFARFAQMVSETMQYQHRMLESAQATMRDIISSNQDTTKLLVDNATASQRMLLENFTSSVESAVTRQMQPIAQLCPALRQCALTLASTREALQTVARPLLIGPPSSHIARISEIRQSVSQHRDSEASPAPSVSREQQPTGQSSNAAATRVDATDHGATSQARKSHRREEEQPAEPQHQHQDRDGSPDPRDPSPAGTSSQ